MKNMLRVLVFVILLAALVLLAVMMITGRAGPMINNLYGSWRSTQSGLTLDFRQNGHLLMTNQGVIQDSVFELTGAANDTLVIKPNGDVPTDQGSSLTFTLNGDTLTLMVQGQPQDFTRQK
jgi:hypothetical protein